MPAETYIAKTIETAPDAIASLVRWKIALLLAARMREPLSERATRSIQNPEECSIRKWLLSRYTEHLRNTPEYRVAVDRHAAFHGQMLRVANLINNAQYDHAEALVNAAEPFQSASIALANAIMALNRVPSVRSPASGEIARNRDSPIRPAPAER